MVKMENYLNIFNLLIRSILAVDGRYVSREILLARIRILVHLSGILQNLAKNEKNGQKWTKFGRKLDIFGSPI